MLCKQNNFNTNFSSFIVKMAKIITATLCSSFFRRRIETKEIRKVGQALCVSMPLLKHFPNAQNHWNDFDIL